ncbi:MAG: dihydrolipoyllysine-residue succinyltransferase [Rhodospirillaceae bacterium]|nr:dihydrolipoyllysine-residue succinyltransferase [Rhodospirillaceae bacterium]
MAEIRVPTLGESVTEATVAQWFKSPGEAVARDEALVELETDKVSLEVNATADGVLGDVLVEVGDTVEVGGLLGHINEGATAEAAGPAATKVATETATRPATAAEAAPQAKPADGEKPLSPAVRKLVEENDLNPAEIPATGKDGRLVKGDVLAYMDSGKAEPAKAPAPPPPPPPQQQAPAPAPAARPSGPRANAEREERVRMTRLRRRIAERLKEAQNTAAMLTTFNEVDMTAVMELRKVYREDFEKKHGVRLGFMSFFAKAAVVALKEIPAVNAEIDGEDIVYKNYYDIGVAVGAPQGLVVPVIRDVDKMNFATVETTINEYGRKARDGKLTMEELTGGTFTISNGGVYGSLLSTPIINPPQSAILGMHKIQPRPMAIGDKVEVRPMMYLALSYDHRIVDGREAVTFLVRLKECIEAPQRILLDI